MRKLSRQASLQLVWLLRDGGSKVTFWLGFQPLCIQPSTFLFIHLLPGAIGIGFSLKGVVGGGVLLETKILIFSTFDVPLGVLAYQPLISASLLSVVVTGKGRDHSCSSKSGPQSHRVHKLRPVQGSMLRVCRRMKPQNPLCS